MATNNADNRSTVLTVAQGGTGLATLTAHSVQIGNGTGNVTQLAVGASNSLMVGSSSADPSFTTSGTIYVTNVTISSGTALANYSTGTFSPTVVNSTTPPTLTYSYQVGRYTRIGNRAVVNINVALATYAAGTGNTQLGALPFTTNSTAGNQPNWIVEIENTALVSLYYVTNAQVNATVFFLAGINSGTGVTNLVAAAPTATSIFRSTTIYEI